MDGVDYTRLRLALWEEPGARGELSAWIEGRLAERGIEPLPAPPRVRVRPWSTTARFATSHGPVWFKADPPESAFEAALLGALHAWVPGRVPAPIAVDAKRGWSLLPDGGAPMVGRMRSLRDFAVWESVLRGYAELQRGLTGRVRDMLVLGVPDLRPPALGHRLDGLLADPGVAAELGEDLPAVAAFRAGLDRFTGALADSGVPASVDHSDLSMGNVFRHAGGYRFIDWGDASVAHPFTSLLVPFDFIAAELSPGVRVMRRLRDAYLEPWSGAAPPAELRTAVRRALRLGAISRALAWTRVFPELRDEVRDAHLRQTAAWLRRLTGDALPPPPDRT
ncbi:phosphotransferase family protein [Nocardiopsis potens]|uniref:phosphotransferase n=1 Tax=Nocardiopsis potens TaxID=1246458 RepID=UPI000349815F|nr:phosphotransferase [Nocardiopsis potens]